MTDLNQTMLRTIWRAYYYQQRDKKAALTGIPVRRPGRPRKAETVTVACTDVSGQEVQQQSA
jgi:hypothetical protein